MLVRLSADGAVLQTTRFPAAVAADPGRRDGIMCVAAAGVEPAGGGGGDSGGLVVFATGYAGGDSGYSNATGYDEQPMFFISGGHAFVVRHGPWRTCTTAAAAWLVRTVGARRKPSRVTAVR